MARTASPAHSKSIFARLWPDLHYPRCDGARVGMSLGCAAAQGLPRRRRATSSPSRAWATGVRDEPGLAGAAPQVERAWLDVAVCCRRYDQNSSQA